MVILLPCITVANPVNHVKYAIVVSNLTFSRPDWAEVVNALKAKYQAQVFVYEDPDLESVKEKLRRFFPTYICFVTQPLEATKEFIATIHRLTRELDKDPYGDAIWGVLTGYNAEDALKIVRGPSELIISNALLKTSGGWLKYFKKGRFYSETEYELMWIKHSDGAIDKSQKGPHDCTKTLVNLLNSNQYDIMITSGHAEEHKWQLHYPDPGEEGFFWSNAGQLYGIPYSGSVVEVNSTNPKVYWGLGNCLIGHINDMNCMVLAWFHTGGAFQFCGYTVKTSYGYMGWGIADYFLKLQDRFTFAESFYLNNQALIFDLENNTPGRKAYELSYDRDSVAFYGDPAFEARLEKCREPLYNQELTVTQEGKGYRFTFLIRMNETGHPERPPIAFLPFRTRDAKIIFTNAHKVVITDNFVLMHVWQEGDPELQQGEERKVTFIATPIDVDVIDIVNVGISEETSSTPQTSLIANPGDRIRLWYEIENKKSENIQAILGASLLQNGREIVDPDDDELVTISPGTRWYSRYFDIPSDASGSYKVVYKVWKPDWSDWYDFKQMENLTVTPPTKIPDIELSKTRIDFGSVNIGNEKQDFSLYVYNKGSADLIIEVNLTGDKDFSYIPPPSAVTISPGGKYQIVVKFKPTSTGSKSATLNIYSNDPDEDPVTVSLTGVGIKEMETIVDNTSPWKRERISYKDDRYDVRMPLEFPARVFEWIFYGWRYFSERIDPRELGDKIEEYFKDRIIGLNNRLKRYARSKSTGDDDTMVDRSKGYRATTSDATIPADKHIS